MFTLSDMKAFLLDKYLGRKPISESRESSFKFIENDTCGSKLVEELSIVSQRIISKELGYVAKVFRIKIGHGDKSDYSTIKIIFPDEGNDTKQSEQFIARLIKSIEETR